MTSRGVPHGVQEEAHLLQGMIRRLSSLERASGRRAVYGSWYLAGVGTSGIVTQVTLGLDTERVNTGEFTFASNTATVGQAGDYLVMADVGLTTDPASSDRGEAAVFLYRNGIELPSSRSISYQRGIGEGTSASISMIVTLAAGDGIRLGTIRTGGINTTIFQESGMTRLTLERRG